MLACLNWEVDKNSREREWENERNRFSVLCERESGERERALTWLQMHRLQTQLRLADRHCPQYSVFASWCLQLHISWCFSTANLLSTGLSGVEDSLTRERRTKADLGSQAGHRAGNVLSSDLFCLPKGETWQRERELSVAKTKPWTGNRNFPPLQRRMAEKAAIYEEWCSVWGQQQPVTLVWHTEPAACSLVSRGEY